MRDVAAPTRRGYLAALVLVVLAAGCAGGDGARVVDSPTPQATGRTSSPPADGPATPASPGDGVGAPSATATPGSEEGAGTATEEPDISEVRLELRTVLEGLSNPLQILSHPTDGSLVIVEQSGVVSAVRGENVETLVDVSDRVTFGGEQGLLGVDFHPSYPVDPRLFLHYSGAPDGDTVVSSIPLGDGGTASDEIVLLEVDQPAANHNGGSLRFGPDGMLYLGLGDGGGADDQFGNGQDPTTRLGTILRMDADSTQDALIAPADNPFVDRGGDPLVWHYGLRNPYRFTFDRGVLYVADVGQDAVEEVATVAADDAALNFGWPILEGSHCFRAAQCDRSGLVLPTVEYTHADTGGCSVIGGEVYRGDAIRGLDGHYLYGDLCAGLLRSFELAGGEPAERWDWTEQVGGVEGLIGFGTDAAGELYLGFADGRVRRLVPAG